LQGLAVLAWQESLELFAIGTCADVACTTVNRTVVDYGGEADGFDHFVPSSMDFAKFDAEGRPIIL
jgi:hypothetical protein